MMSRGPVTKGRSGFGLVTRALESTALLKSTALLVVLLLLLGTAQAAPPAPYRVKDIEPGAGGSNPRDLASSGGILFFEANDGPGGHGDELWRSNGSETGTTLVKDINPSGSSSPYELTEVGAEVFFRADDGTYGRELWASDGSEAGTRRVKDINPGAGYSYPGGLTEVNGHLFFHADDGALGHGRELWESDGTDTGTALVRDINPGAGGSNPGHLVEAGGVLYFSAQESANGDELWRSDGRAAGTYIVKNIRPGALGSYLEDMVNVGGTLFFSADDGSHGRELWKSNGTESGTVLVKDINDGAGSSNPQALADVNGVLIFSADDGAEHGRELWKSDGTAVGTVMIKDIVPGSGSSTPDNFTRVNTSGFQGFLFAASDGPAGGHGNELWKSDGTESGTEMVRDLNPGGADSYPQSLAPVGGWVYFSADDGDAAPGGHGRELWKSNGTEAGTVLLGDINDGPEPSNPHALEAEGGLFFFNADDGAHGPELWALVAYAPDLMMSKKVASATTLAPGDPVTYTLSFVNDGNSAATGVVVTDNVPSELTGIQVESDLSLSLIAGTTYSWELADLAPAEGGMITITAVVQPVQDQGYAFGNTATIATTALESDLGDNEGSVQVTINYPPVGEDDGWTTDEDEELAVSAPGVLDNDSDPEDSPLTAVLDAPPAVGELVLETDGSFTYTPQPNYHSVVSFDYRAHDGLFDSNRSRVTLNVTSVNDSPVAEDDSYRTIEDEPKSVPAPGVLFNDQDDDSDPLTTVLDQGPEKGDLVLNPDGSFIYTPKANSNGMFSFTYRAYDGQVESRRATVTLEVTAENDAPVANDDGYSTREDEVLRLRAPGVLENDNDPDGDDLTAILDSPPEVGELALLPDGSLHYTPTRNYYGQVSFVYHSTDGIVVSDRATVTLDVTPVNDVPEALSNNYKTLTNQVRQVAAPGVLGNDRDVEGDGLTAVLDKGPDKGQVEFNADGSFVYTPQPDTEGVFPFKYHAHDGTDDSEQAIVTLTVAATNEAPTAVGDAYTTAEETGLVVPAPGVLDNDDDPDKDLLTVRLEAPPPDGDLLLDPDGSFVYTPAVDYYGLVSFTYRAYDGLEESEPVPVDLTVTPVNDAPEAMDDAYLTTDEKNLEIPALGVLANDRDVDSDSLTALLDAPPQDGTLVLNEDGSFSYEPVAGHFGSFAFTYRASDGQVNSGPATVTIRVAESLPVYLPLIRR